MNGNDDDRLGRTLREETARDLPGPEFGRRVMEAVEEERERFRLQGPRPSPARRLLGVAAALGFVALGIWAVVSGRLARPGAGGSDDENLTVPGLELPSARSAVARLRAVRITMTAEREVRVEGRRVDDLRDLPARLAAAAARDRAAGEVILRVDRRVKWREVQWLLQACAHPDVRLYRMQFAVAGPNGPALLPGSLPRESGGADEDEDPLFPEGVGGAGRRVVDLPLERPVVTIVLRRTGGEDRTVVRLMDRDLGRGEPAFVALGENLRAILRAGRELYAELNAWPDVPYEDVIHALDLWHGAGGGDATLTGIAPAGAGSGR